MRQFCNKYFPAVEEWHFLCKEFTSEANMGQNALIHQVFRLKMEPGKANDYIAEKMKLRNRLFAVNYPTTRITFNDYLVQGLSEEWETFKITMRELSRTKTEEQIIATIRDENNVSIVAGLSPKERTSLMHLPTGEAIKCKEWIFLNLVFPQVRSATDANDFVSLKLNKRLFKGLTPYHEHHLEWGARV